MYKHKRFGSKSSFFDPQFLFLIGLFVAIIITTRIEQKNVNEKQKEGNDADDVVVGGAVNDDGDVDIENQ